MAKAKRQTISSQTFERAIRAGVDAIPGLDSLPEGAYVALYLEALDVIKDGLEMRQHELRAEGE